MAVRIFWFLLLFPSFLFSQTFNPEIYDSKSRSKVELSSIVEKAKDADVIIFGEEHNDKVGHAWKLDAFKKLASVYSALLSLEMLEKDQQRSVDEYCKGEITERGFLNSGKFWPNYQTDYHPLVSFAKEKIYLCLRLTLPENM